MTQLTLIACAGAVPLTHLPGGFAARAPTAADTDQLGQLYFQSLGFRPIPR